MRFITTSPRLGVTLGACLLLGSGSSTSGPTFMDTFDGPFVTGGPPAPPLANQPTGPSHELPDHA